MFIKDNEISPYGSYTFPDFIKCPVIFKYTTKIQL